MQTVVTKDFENSAMGLLEKARHSSVQRAQEQMSNGKSSSNTCGSNNINSTERENFFEIGHLLVVYGLKYRAF